MVQTADTASRSGLRIPQDKEDSGYYPNWILAKEDINRKEPIRVELEGACVKTPFENLLAVKGQKSHHYTLHINYVSMTHN